MGQGQLGPAWLRGQRGQHDPVAYATQPAVLGHLIQSGPHPLGSAVQ
jgi:hypothetical protein